MNSENNIRLSLVEKIGWAAAYALMFVAAMALITNRIGFSIFIAFGLGVVVCVIVLSTRAIQRLRLRQLIRLVLLAAASAGAVAWCYSTTTPERLFREYVTAPIPTTVRIIDAHYDVSLRDPAIYIHFQAAPADMETVLGKASHVDEADQKGYMLPLVLQPTWWKPQSLTNRSLYVLENKGESTIWIWVNPERTEAYFQRLYF